MRRKFRIAAVVAASLVLLANSVASDPSLVAESYLESLVQGNISAGFVELMKHSDIDEQNPEGIGAKANQIEETISRYGTPLRFETISRKNFGESTMHLSYATIHAAKPLVWQFLFYRAKSKWVLIELRYNDDAKYLLD